MTGQSKDFFPGIVHDITSELERRGVPYLAIGSIALDALGLRELDLLPRYKFPDLLDQSPDLDLIVPRDTLPDARKVRKRFEKEAVPVKVGLAVPSMLVDYHPGSSSYLTYGRRSVEVTKTILEPQVGDFRGVPISTVSAETLRHIYGYMSPKTSSKYDNYQEKFYGISARLGVGTECKTGHSH